LIENHFCLQVIVFEGTPSITTKACAPQSLLTGMNKFLQQLEVTFRRDPDNFRSVNPYFYRHSSDRFSRHSFTSTLKLAEK
jgi:translation initiation factor RLI1